ncbi:MAG TPA: signal peptide peptidase SppA [Anaeromyxobacteraceae bacterium]|nr:signal peptide peptidase SppA [Anaeromyxobacteraceae bacterium]
MSPGESARRRAAATARAAHLAVAVAAAVAAAPARPQSVLTSDLASGIPVGLAVPNTVAGADEPTAVSVNPSGLGFVGGATLQYFLQDSQAGSLLGNGVYAAVPVGPVVPALSLEWMSPAAGPRYLKTEFALAFGVGQVFAAGYGFNFYSSPAAGLNGLFDMDFGFTVRPARFLSLGASIMGFAGRMDGQPVTVRYNFGAAARPIDLLTVAFDMYANDAGVNAFVVQQGAVTASASLPCGLALQAQYLFPLSAGLPSAERAQAVQIVLTGNLPHVGATVGGQVFNSNVPDGSGMLYGVRLSAERYRSRGILRTVQVVDLDAELRPPSLLETILGATGDRYGALLKKLRRLENDPSVSGVLLEVGPVPVGLARTEELRQAVHRLSGRKPVVASISSLGGSKAYWLGCAATEVYAAPGSVVVAKGLASTSFFLRGGLGKLGIAVESVAAGRYKSAPDALTRSSPSDAQREATASILDSEYDILVKGIARDRRLPEPKVRELLDVGVFTAEEAKRESLLDGALWPDEVERRARQLAGGGNVTGRFDESPRRASDRWGPEPYIAVVPVEGAIAAGANRREAFTGTAIAGSDTVAKLIREAASDPLAKAIVLRVDSPGGDGFASDLVWRAVVEARRRGKPVVASMADVAASGGYLVSVAADAIVAEPATLTGSIGVFALKPDVSGLLEKLGVTVWSEQRGKNARIDSYVKAWTPEERQLVERQVRAFYDQFVAKVADGRHLSREDVDRVAQGRVWTGEQALARKLVDRLGGLEDAVALARDLAGVSPGADVAVRRLEAKGGLFAAFSGGTAMEPAPLQSALARIPEVEALALLGEMGTVLALPMDWAGLPDPGPP